MKRRPVYIAGAFVLIVSACGRQADVASAPQSPSATSQQGALERCRNRGVQVYNDQACMDAWKKRTDAFYGKSGESRR